MLVGRSNGVDVHSASPSFKQPKNSTEKAKEVLRKALNDGKLEELLWRVTDPPGEISSSSIRSKRDSRSQPSSRQAAIRSQHLGDISVKEALMVNDVSIWNQFLMARVLHATSKLGARLQNMVQTESVTGAVSHSSDGEANDGDVDDEEERNSFNANGAGANSSSNEEAWENKRPSIRASKPPGIKGYKRSKSSHNSSKIIKNANKSTQSRVPPDPASKTISLEEQLKAFETLPIGNSKDKLYMGSLGKPQRVMDVIKRSRSTAAIVAAVQTEPETGGSNDSFDSEDYDRFSHDVNDVSRLLCYVLWLLNSYITIRIWLRPLCVGQAPPRLLLVIATRTSVHILLRSNNCGVDTALKYLLMWLQAYSRCPMSFERSAREL
jgi:hypothetical protein